MSRVLLANLAQETCSFVQSKHSLDDFRRYYLYTGQEIIRKLRGGGMEVSAIINAAEEEGIELVPLLATYSGTGGPVTTAAYAYLRDEIFAGARRSAAWVDGAILALHGAMLTEELDEAPTHPRQSRTDSGASGGGNLSCAQPEAHLHLGRGVLSLRRTLAARGKSGPGEVARWPSPNLRAVCPGYHRPGCPGPTDSNLARLPYRRVTRPLFPLDDI